VTVQVLVEAQVAVQGNPNNNTPGLPSSPLQVQLWTDAQAQSAAFSSQQDAAYALQPTVHALGQGSVGPGYFSTNGQPPNAGNTPQPG
jgi:hypothetical protein